MNSQTNLNISKLWQVCVLMLLLTVMTALKTQGQSINLSGREMSVADVVGKIQEQTSYVFAVDRKTFDMTRTVKVEPGEYDIDSAVKLMIKGTPFTYMIHSSYVIIDSTPKTQPEKIHAAPSRTDDKYIPGSSEANEQFADMFKPQPRDEQKQPEARPQPKQVKEKVSATEFPEPYSVYNTPSDYMPKRKELPKMALKTNLLYGAAALAPNLAAEIGMKDNTTLEVSVSYNGWERKWEETSQLNHMIIRPEYRWWMCERFNGQFIGANVMLARYHIGGKEVPMLFKKGERYDGYAFGAGFTYGYNLPLAKRWGLEFNVGVGAAYMTYDRYTCEVCDVDAIKTNKFYFGPTRAGVTLVFMMRK